MVLSTSFILSEDESRHLQNGSAPGSFHGDYMTSMTVDPTRFFTWYKFYSSEASQLLQPCIQLGRWLEGASDLEAFFTLLWEENCGCGIPSYCNSPKIREYLFVFLFDKVNVVFVWGVSAVVVGLKLNASRSIMVNKPSRFIWTPFVYFLSVHLKQSSVEPRLPKQDVGGRKWLN